MGQESAIRFPNCHPVDDLWHFVGYSWQLIFCSRVCFKAHWKFNLFHHIYVFWIVFLTKLLLSLQKLDAHFQAPSVITSRLHVGLHVPVLLTYGLRSVRFWKPKILWRASLHTQFNTLMWCIACTCQGWWGCYVYIEGIPPQTHFHFPLQKP